MSSPQIFHPSLSSASNSITPPRHCVAISSFSLDQLPSCFGLPSGPRLPVAQWNLLLCPYSQALPPTSPHLASSLVIVSVWLQTWSTWRSLFSHVRVPRNYLLATTFGMPYGSFATLLLPWLVLLLLTTMCFLNPRTSPLSSRPLNQPMLASNSPLCIPLILMLLLSNSWPLMFPSLRRPHYVITRSKMRIPCFSVTFP